MYHPSLLISKLGIFKPCLSSLSFNGSTHASKPITEFTRSSVNPTLTAAPPPVECPITLTEDRFMFLNKLALKSSLLYDSISSRTLTISPAYVFTKILAYSKKLGVVERGGRASRLTVNFVPSSNTVPTEP